MIRSKIEESNENIKVLDILSYQETEKQIILFALVKWFENKPVLEKRKYYYDKDEKLKTGKLLALNSEDLDTIYSNHSCINKHLDLSIEPN